MLENSRKDYSKHELLEGSCGLLTILRFIKNVTLFLKNLFKFVDIIKCIDLVML